MRSKSATALAQHQLAEKAPTEKTRQAVLDRDNNQCQACGTNNGLQLHHLIYRSQGGGHDKENLITLCLRCHKMHHDGLLDFLVVDLGDNKIAVFCRRKYLTKKRTSQ